MTEEEKRRRAPAMSQEERRDAIVRTTLPLLIEHGGNVSTSQIAAAAGIAEGTVFRAFKDKRDLLIECMRRGMNSDEEVARIEQVDPDLPLQERLTEGLRAVGGYLDRVWSVGQALQAAGVSRDHIERHVHDKDEHQPGPPREMTRVISAMTSLFAPAAGSLRLTPEHAARLLLGLVFTNRMQGHGLGQAMASPDELVDLFLHGIIRTTEGNQP